MLYNISVLSFSGVLLQVMGFVYQVILSRFAGAEGLGVYQLVFPVYSVVMAGTLSGVRLAVTSLSASLSLESDMTQIRALVRRSILSFVFLFSLIGIPAMIFHDFIAEKVIREPRTSAAVVVILVCLFLTGFEAIFESLFLGIGRTKYTAISNLLEQIVKIFVILFLLSRWGKDGDNARTAVLISIGMTISEIPVLIWLLSVYRREIVKGRGVIPHKIKKNCARHMRILPIAIPVSMTSVVTTLLSSATIVLLPGRLMTSGMTKVEAVSALGIVSDMALPLLMLPMVLIRSMSNILLPNLSMSTARHNGPDIERKIQKSFQATGLIVLPATAILVPVAVPLARILFKQELQPLYVMLLAVVAVINYYEVISASILNGLGKQKRTMICMICGEGFQLLLTFYLAASPDFGIYGFIIGMILGPLIVLLLNLISIRQFSSFSPRFSECFLIPLLAGGVSGEFTRYFYRTLQLADGGELGKILLSMALGAMICCVIFLYTGLHPVRYLKTILVADHKTTNEPL